MKTFFVQLVKNFARCFWGYNLLWHLLAVTLTLLVVRTDFDWRYFEATRNPTLQVCTFPAAMLGGLVPLLLPGVLWMVGYARSHKNTIRTAVAVVQAELLGFIISGMYKALTGRPGPMFRGIHPTDISEVFRIGLLRGGVFWGWPSTHTTVALAAGVCIYMLYRNNPFIRTVALIYASYIAFGVSTNIHWFSDVIAGTIFGALIGVVVAQSFLRPEPSTGAALSV